MQNMGTTAKPELLEWAIERSGRNREAILTEVPEARDWLQGKNLPTTIGKLSKFAEATYVSAGFLLEPRPPKERLPYTACRYSSARKKDTSPTANEMDIVYECKDRQQWYRQHRIQHKLYVSPLVGKYKVYDDADKVAADTVKHFSLPQFATKLDKYIELIEAKNIMVMLGGIIKGKYDRELSPIKDLRGFALPDEDAPLIFINGNDSIEGMKFTLMHELAHILLGDDDQDKLSASKIKEHERWCNSVAAEILVPQKELTKRYKSNDANPFAQRNELAEYFGVSTLVIMHRINDIFFSGKHKNFDDLYTKEHDQVFAAFIDGKFSKYKKEREFDEIVMRNSKIFCRELLSSIKKGNTLHSDAMKLLYIGDSDMLLPLQKIANK